MTGIREAADTGTCGCCKTPDDNREHVNPPGCPSLNYRAGTHGTFLERMIRKLPLEEVLDGSGTTLRPLESVTTRETSDPAIALLDAFAVVADVLTFYQERIANECYLRTATERRSVLELARAIGYELSPGVAAGTLLAFTAEDAKGAPAPVTVPAGTRVMSLPAPGKLPQVFETGADLVARPAWNAWKPKTTKLPETIDGTRGVVLKGTGSGIKPGDGILFSSTLYQGYFIIFDILRKITRATIDTKSGTTTVMFDMDGNEAISASSVIFLFHQRAGLFGHNAPDWKTMSGTVLHQGLLGNYFRTKDFHQPAKSQIDPRVVFDWGASNPLGTMNFSIVWTGFVKSEDEGYYTFVTYSDDGVRLWIDGKLVIDDWNEHARQRNACSVLLKRSHLYDIRLEFFQNAGEANVELRWITPGSAAEVAIPGEALFCQKSDNSVDWPDLKFSQDEITGRKIHLDTVYPKIEKDSLVVLSVAAGQDIYRVTGVAEESRMDFTLNAKTTCLTLDHDISAFSDKIRETVVYAQSEPAELAEVPDDSPVSAGTSSLVIAGAPEGPAAGKLLLVTGMSPEGKPVSEAVTLAGEPETDGTDATLTFTAALKNSYRRDSVTVWGNVVPATHGETVSETLGSGNAGMPGQQFTLKKPPLTCVPDTASGRTKSTLSVRVDGLEWEEVPVLYGMDASGENYMVRIDNDARANVIFGDGRQGARLTSGTENVTARYRSGTGPDGNVTAGSLSILPARPQGIRGVTNPVQAAGGVAPEDRDHARENAPMKIRTFDRIVSLKDYEDFALAYPGVSKARADRVWNGEECIVLITVLGPGGTRVESGSAACPGLLENLCRSVREAQDPGHSVIVISAEPLLFRVHVSAAFDTPRYREETVKAAVRDALLEAFSFRKRVYAGDVTESDIIRVVRSVPGVIDARVDAGSDAFSTSPQSLRIRTDGASYRRYLHADPGVFRGAGDISAAQILIIDPDGIRINGGVA